jgi:hypothetical protein
MLDVVKATVIAVAAQKILSIELSSHILLIVGGQTSAPIVVMSLLFCEDR